MSNWEIKKLGDITSWFSGGTPQKNEPAYWNGDIPWISANSMDGTRYYTSDLKITPEGLRNGSRLAPQDAILLLVRGGALHTKIPIGIARKPLAFNQDVKAIVAKPGLIDPWFLLAWFMSKRDYLLKTVVEYTGIGAGKLDTLRLQNLDINLPPIEEQKALAHIATCLEDKIELNQRMNETLEGIAQALFKSWFVDFDPVKAKAEGRRPEGINDLTSALFPSSFDDKNIPQGWSSQNVAEVIELNPYEKLPKGEMAPYFEMAILPTKGCIPSPPIMREFSSGTKFRNGDTLLARITPCLENGKTAYINGLAHDQIAWGSTEFIVMRSKSPLPPEYTYLLARDENFRAHAIKSMTGTSGRQRVQVDTLGKYRICMPTEEVAKEFGQCVRPIFKRIAVLSKESNILSQIRDTLLPRLISGELGVGEISEIMEVVTS